MDQNFINVMTTRLRRSNERIEVYLDQTSPLIDYYRDHGKLVEIDGTQSIEQVTRRSCSHALKK